MSKPRKYKNRIRNKLGYFDFYIDVSGRYRDKQVTHRELIIDLLRNSKLQNCMRVWNGENIECITNNLEEQKVLYVLALCMIEQDINWGPQEWQTNSNFNFRPRDMLIGFIRIAFYFNDIDEIPYWNSNNSTPTFGRGEYARFPKDLKENFENFNGYNPISVMSGEILTLCRRKVLNKENNPYV
ncbi:hypothetical protein DP122_01745 [Clostridium tetani]|nr:hypothetical protein DP129_00030 [Clostridium tetani]RXI56647.1 hypothetical protein DP122_01745 [Clostridium tetani]RXI78347.1 hypothetical protein DP128_00870 [Clostridium tetani]